MPIDRVARLEIVLFVSLVAFAVGVADVQAQTQAADPNAPTLGWSNTTDLSLVVTGGNSDSATVGFSDQLRYVGNEVRLEFEVSVIRSNKSDDRFFLIDPGLEFAVGGAPPATASAIPTAKKRSRIPKRIAGSPVVQTALVMKF